MPLRPLTQSDQTSLGMEGSVFDSPMDKLRRMALKDPMGGMSPQPAIVLNPGHQSFKVVQQYAPEVAQAMQKAPGRIGFLDRPESYFQRVGAFGTTNPPRSPGGFTAVSIHPKLGGEIERMVEKSGVDWKPAVTVHEAYGHALPLAATGGEMKYPFTPEQALALLQQELRNPMQLHSQDYLTRLLGIYRNNAPHAAVETTANNMVVLQGGTPMIRNLSGVPDADIRAAKRLLGF